MKSVVLAFIGAASAHQAQDAPPYFNEPTWNEKYPSASGFVEISACHSAGVAGVTCTPTNEQLFAEGMKGDEDLGQDITMKGEKYHYHQGKVAAPAKASFLSWNPVVVSQPYETLPFCNGVNGPDGVNCRIEGCTGTNGVKDGPVGSSCDRAQPKFIPHYTEDPTRGRRYETTGDLTRNSLVEKSNQQKLVSFLQLEDIEAEKVSVLQTPYATGHTSFY